MWVVVLETGNYVDPSKTHLVVYGGFPDKEEAEAWAGKDLKPTIERDERIHVKEVFPVR